MKGNLPKMGSPQKQQEIKKDLTYKVILIPIVASPQGQIRSKCGKNNIQRIHWTQFYCLVFQAECQRPECVTEPLKKYHDAVAAWFHENRDGRFN